MFRKYFFWILVFGFGMVACGEDPVDGDRERHVSVTVGADGATIVTGDNVRVIIPPGALVSDVRVDVWPTEISGEKVNAVSRVYAITPENLLLKKSIQLEMPFPPESIAPDGLKIFRVQSGADGVPAFEALQSIVNVDRHTIAAKAMQFGFFVVGRYGETGLSTVIGQSGGVLDVSGLTLNVPAGAFSAEQTITVRPLQIFVPGMQQQSTMFELSPLGTQFQMPVQLVIPYTGETPVNQSLIAFRSDSSDAPMSEWQPLTSVVQPLDRTVTTAITRFGFFIVSAQTPIEVDTDTFTDTHTDTDADSGIASDTSAPLPGKDWVWVSGDSIGDQAGVYGIRGIADSANKPGGRFHAHSAADSNGNFWLFGGFGVDSTGEEGTLNDLWKFDGTSWTWMSGSNQCWQVGIYGTKGIAEPANAPGTRSDASGWIDDSDHLWLFGGDGFDSVDQSKLLNDLWMY